MAKRRNSAGGLNGIHLDDGLAPSQSLQTRTIEVPFGDLPPSRGYEAQEVECGRIGLGLHVNAQLGREDAETFIRIREGLRSTNGRLKDGKPVWTNVEVLKWMMEQVDV